MAKKPHTNPPKPKDLADHLTDAWHAAGHAHDSVLAAEKEAATMGPQLSPAVRAGIRNLRNALQASETQLRALSGHMKPAEAPLTPPPG